MDGIQDRMKEKDPTHGKYGAMRDQEVSGQGFKMMKRVI